MSRLLPKAILFMSKKLVVIGKFGKTFGVRGWLKVNSFTFPKENILNYKNWHIKRNSDWLEIFIESHKFQHHNILVKLTNCNSIEDATLYVNHEIAVDRQELPELSVGEYYWRDLEGLKVINKKGVKFGKVDYLFATGANDVLVVKNHHQYFIPFVKNTIVKVDLEEGLIVVDWEKNFI